MTASEEVQKLLKGGVFKIELKSIGETALGIMGAKIDYTNAELADALLVFTQVFLSKTYDFHKDKLSQEQLEQLATEAGISLRQTILLFTGIDTHKIYDK